MPERITLFYQFLFQSTVICYIRIRIRKNGYSVRHLSHENRLHKSCIWFESILDNRISLSLWTEWNFSGRRNNFHLYVCCPSVLNGRCPAWSWKATILPLHYSEKKQIISSAVYIPFRFSSWRTIMSSRFNAFLQEKSRLLRPELPTMQLPVSFHSSVNIR